MPFVERSRQGDGCRASLAAAVLFPAWWLRRRCRTKATTARQAKKRGFGATQPKEVEVLDAAVVVEGKPAAPSSASTDAEMPEVLTEDMKDLRQAAEAGDRDAQFRFGKALLKGWEGQEANEASASEWLIRAAEGGHRPAQSALGEMYYTGLGRPQNKVEAFKWLKQAAEPPVPEAQFNLGVMLQSGDGVAVDKKEALKYYLGAAQAGLTRAMNNLAYMYRAGDGVDEDKELALEWYMKAAKMGDMDGQYHVGEMYHEGEGVKISKRRAGRWFLKAAKQGRKEAQYNVAMMYHFGPLLLTSPNRFFQESYYFWRRNVVLLLIPSSVELASSQSKQLACLGPSRHLSLCCECGAVRC